MIEYEMQIDEWLEFRKSRLKRDLEIIEEILRQRKAQRINKAVEQGILNEEIEK
jgi:hypothetical protein